MLVMVGFPNHFYSVFVGAEAKHDGRCLIVAFRFFRIQARTTASQRA
jgi:hypothetical protein